MRVEKNRIHSDIEIHIFVCTNERTNKNKSCGKSGSLPLFKHLKQRIKSVSESFNKTVKVNSSGCLSNCSSGPVLVLYPQGTWYNVKTTRDVDMLVDSLAKIWLEEMKSIKSAAG